MQLDTAKMAGLALAIMLVATPAASQTDQSTDASAPPSGTLRLLEGPRAGNLQQWLELSSITRQVPKARVWVLQAAVTDMTSAKGAASGAWVQYQIDCAQRTMGLEKAFMLSAETLALQPLVLPPQPVAVQADGTAGADLVRAACTNPAANTGFATSAKQAIHFTRTGTHPAPTLVAAPKPLTASERRSCAITYQALNSVAIERSIFGTLEGLTPEETARTTTAQKAYSDRVGAADPSAAPVVIWANANELSDAYRDADGEAKGPQKMAILNRLKAAAAICDKSLGLSPIDLP